MHFSASTFLTPYFHQFSAVVQNLFLIWGYFGQIYIKFGANFAYFFAETAPSVGAIWDEFREQH